MAENSKIEWCSHTFNHVIGCSKVHEGCAQCYAEADMAVRRKRVTWGPHGTRSRTSDAYWRMPLKWNREAAASLRSWAVASSRSEYDTVEPYERPRVFCASLADVFEDWQGPIVNCDGRQLFSDGTFGGIPVRLALPIDATEAHRKAIDRGCRPLTMDDLRRDLFTIIDQTPHLDWLLLTKRPENISRMWPAHGIGDFHDKDEVSTFSYYRPNCWIGTSVSNQQTADAMLPKLLDCHSLSPVLFVSAEPLLGPIDFRGFLCPACGGEGPLLGAFGEELIDCEHKHPRLDWVIFGGESGHNSRPCNVQWIRDGNRQCRQADVPFFNKQLGSVVLWDGFQGGYGDGPSNVWPRETGTFAYAKKDWSGFRKCLVDRKGGEMSEWPEDLRVREFPRVGVVA